MDTVMIKCSKCGYENPNQANFCGNCGESLENEKAIIQEQNQIYLCPKCGSKFVGKIKYCNNCGLEFNWPKGDFNAVPIKNRDQLKAKKESLEINKIQLFKILFYLFVSLISFVALWLPFINVSSSEIMVNTSFDCSYWFVQMWENAKYSLLDSSDIFGFTTFVIFGLIVISSSITAIVLGIISIVKKKENLTRLFSTISIASCFTYFLIIYTSLFVTATSNTSYAYPTTAKVISMGAGMILSIVLLGIDIAAEICFGILNYVKTKSFFPGSFILKILIPVLTILSIGLFSVVSHHIDNVLTIQTIDVNLSTSYTVFSFPFVLKELFNTFEDDIYVYARTFGLLEIIFSYLAIVGLLNTFIYSLLNIKNKSCLGTIISSSVSFAFSIIALIFTILSQHQTNFVFDNNQQFPNTSTSFIPTLIFIVLLSLAALILAIVSSCLNRNQNIKINRKSNLI